MTVRQLILDTETTGLSPDEGHRIIEFAALEVVNRKLTGNKLHIYINPEREIDIEATKIHGITNEHVKNELTFDKVVEDIIDFINGSELIIHNAKFDIGFLDYQFQKAGHKRTSNYVSGVVDTLIIARQKFPGGKNSLDALCDRFNINRSHRDFHGALVDCRLLLDVYLALTREQISLLADDTDKHKNIEFKKLDATESDLKIMLATPSELALHSKYLDDLNQISEGSCLWFNHTHNDK
ncbi:MAG: dnaQ [Burkholderiales bacterium]|jgi:DNA polymerase-3 subunit epsilon|nr:dnaQ [Burkholderiales bacterium]